MARLAAYVQRGSKFVRQPDLEDGISEVIVFSNGNLRLCGLYRPFKPPPEMSSSMAFDSLLSNLESVTRTNQDIVIGGDFNVNWEQESSKKKRLESWAESGGLIQSVTETTRHQTVTSPTIRWYTN